MSDEKIWSVTMIGDATLYRFGNGKYCVLQDGRFTPDSEDVCFFLGKDRYWHRRGDLFDNEVDSINAFERHLVLAKA